ncbi:N-acetylmuramoyl-L-alanine amidase [Hwanghaeella sp.]|uniref:N-acetylmuramoyl-L-alanine amidase n=1 Tax=Hwanghaeella sp. TaxID=2605943 RepID=UPI003CCC0567
MSAADLPILERPSPNFGERKGGGTIDMLVLHYTDTESAEDALEILCDPSKEVSAHYLIDEDGTVYRLVAEEKRAWHAGLSYWRGQRDVNSHSIGIELQNPGERFGYRPFAEPQMAALISLCRGILQRWQIPSRNVVGHSDIACDRKHDPGHLFNWQGLARAGIGFWPDKFDARPEDLPGLLTEIGYDPDCACAVEAFQRHYRPSLIDNRPDAETAGLAAGLLRHLAHPTT